MREFQEKKKTINILYSKMSIVVLIIVLFLAAKSLWGVYDKEKESAALKEQSEERLADLQSRENALTQENDALATPEGVENDIREDYHMVKPGEQLVVIENAPTSTPTAPTQGNLKSFWASVVNFFHGND